MPKKVWKCNHCIVTGTMKKVKEHEENCSCNPELKLCYSCDHHVSLSTGLACLIFPVQQHLKIRKNRLECKKWKEEIQ